MITTSDDLVKVLLAGSISFAIVLIAIGIFRLFDGFTKSLREVNGILENVSELTDTFVEDYLSIKSFISNFFSSYETFVKPAIRLFNFFSRRGEGKSEETFRKEKDLS